VRKSQTATEYLVILTVVIVVAIVAINTLGGFSGIGANDIQKVSAYKLQTDKIGIESYLIGTNSSLFKLKNNNYDTVTVNEFRLNQQNNLTCNSSNTIPSLPIVLNIGESKVINCSAVNSSNYIITNKQTPLVGLLYTDSITSNRLAGNVESYGNASSGNSGGNPAIPEVPYIPSDTVISLRDGLIAYYPLDGNASDLSGNANDGNNNGASYNQSGKLGGAYSFNGINNYIDIPNAQSLNPGANISISFWANPTSFNLLSSGDTVTVITKGVNADAAMDWFVGLNLGGYIRSYIYSGGSWNGKDPGVNSLSLNNWNFVTVTFDGTTGILKLYLNGVLDSTKTISSGTIQASSGNLKIGTYNPGGYYSNFYRGKLDEVSIWNRTLNSTEISTLYNSSNGLSLSLSGPQTPLCAEGQSSCNGSNYLICTNTVWVNQGNVSGHCDYVTPGDINVLRTGLVAYWPLDGNLSDESGNGNTGINHGATYTQSGKVGGTFTFDGSSVITSTNNVGISGTQSRTLNLWLKYASPLSSMGVAGWGIDDWGNTYQILNLNDHFYFGGYVYDAEGSIFIGDDSWHMLTVTYDGSNVYLYEDGHLDLNVNPINWGGTIPLNTVDSVFNIGSLADGTSRLTGSIDEVGIWNRALNDTEILQLYNSSSGFSLSLSGSHAPQCVESQLNCSGTVSLTCTNSTWVNNGNVSGQCGYISPSALTALKQGIVGYWPFDGNTSDLSGYNHNGENDGADYTSFGKVGGAYSFNGYNSLISVPNTANFYGMTNLSVCAWVYINGEGRDNGIFLVQQNQQYEGGASWGLFWWHNGGYPLGFSVTTNESSWVDKPSTSLLQPGQWYHVCGTYRSGELKEYINSQLDRTYTGGSAPTGRIASTNGPLLFGAETTWQDERFNGLIDEAVIWNRTLNSTEISELYGSGTGISLVQ
jgi:hypothetical protein